MCHLAFTPEYRQQKCFINLLLSYETSDYKIIHVQIIKKTSRSKVTCNLPSHSYICIYIDTNIYIYIFNCLFGICVS